MKVARQRSPRSTRVGRSRIFALLLLFLAGSIFSITASLVQPDTANALTQAEKDHCLATYKPGATLPLNGDFDKNNCDQVCETESDPYSENPITTVKSCNANAQVDGAAPNNDFQAKTTGILKDKYGNSAVVGYCGTDKTCIKNNQEKVRNATAKCVETYNYQENGGTFPDINPDALAFCVRQQLGLTDKQEADIEKQFKKDHDAITDEANAASGVETQDACEDQGGTWNADEEQCEEPEGTNCAVEGIGWAICPAMNFMAQLNDMAYAFLASNFLSVNTDLVDGAQDAWAKFRDVANVLFVIAFLVVVYSQLTSVGISNYGIKKMLPKIVVAAILVNMSFIICQLAVDLSNILGYGVTKFFEGIKVGSGVDDTSNLDLLGNGLTWVAVIGGVLAGVVGIAMAISVPVLLSAVLAIGLIVLILVGRQALIVLLVAIAPVAFVAYLLPNTEQWFKKWVKMFSTLLLLFPIIGLVFGASRLAAIIINNASGSDWVMKLVALGVTAVPFFVVPGLLKGALSAAGSLGTKLSGMADKATGKVGGKVKDTSMLGAIAKQRSRAKELKRAQVLGGRAGNPLTKRWYRGINSMTGKYGDRISAQAASTAQKLKNEDVDNEVARMLGGWQPHEELGKAAEAYEDALRSNDTVKARAAQKILLSKGNAGVGKIQDIVESGAADSGNDAVQHAKSDLASAGLKGKNAALNAWSYDNKGAGGLGRSFQEVKDDAATYDGLNDSEFSSQSSGTMNHALSVGGLSKERADRILDNKDLHGNLDNNKFDVLYRASGTTPGGAPSGGSTSGSAGGGSSSGSTSGSGSSGSGSGSSSGSSGASGSSGSSSSGGTP